MTRKAKDAPVVEGERVAYSWLPAGFNAGGALAGSYWKPEPGDAKVIEVVGFEKREGENGEYTVWVATDLQTGEQFQFTPGGLFDYLAGEGKIVTGAKLGIRYKGTKRLPNGFNANDWDIVTLK